MRHTQQHTCLSMVCWKKSFSWFCTFAVFSVSLGLLLSFCEQHIAKNTAATVLYTDGSIHADYHHVLTTLSWIAQSCGNIITASSCNVSLWMGNALLINQAFIWTTLGVCMLSSCVWIVSILLVLALSMLARTTWLLNISMKWASLINAGPCMFW